MEHFYMQSIALAPNSAAASQLEYFQQIGNRLVNYLGFQRDFNQESVQPIDRIAWHHMHSTSIAWNSSARTLSTSRKISNLVREKEYT